MAPITVERSDPSQPITLLGQFSSAQSAGLSPQPSKRILPEFVRTISVSNGQTQMCWKSGPHVEQRHGPICSLHSKGRAGGWADAAWQLPTHLRMHSRACVKTCGAMPCSCCRIRHCSRVTDMAVRSLALLQLVNRTPLRRRQTCGRKKALRRGKTSKKAACSRDRAHHRSGRNTNNKIIPHLFLA